MDVNPLWHVVLVDLLTAEVIPCIVGRSLRYRWRIDACGRVGAVIIACEVSLVSALDVVACSGGEFAAVDDLNATAVSKEHSLCSLNLDIVESDVADVALRTSEEVD